jgi:hypothetical protein
MRPRLRLILLASVTLCVLTAGFQSGQNRPPQVKYPGLPSETPAQSQPVTSSFNYARREVMIPMRDGVRLRTVIFVPKGAKNAPILLTRTPYNAGQSLRSSPSAHFDDGAAFYVREFVGTSTLKSDPDIMRVFWLSKCSTNCRDTRSL